MNVDITGDHQECGSKSGIDRGYTLHRYPLIASDGAQPVRRGTLAAQWRTCARSPGSRRLARAGKPA